MIKCQLESTLYSAGKLDYPLKKKIKNAVKRIPFIVPLKSSIIKAITGPKHTQEKDDARKKILIPPDQKVLGLRVGEWVEVRSAEEIRRTLDEDGAFDRNIFMNGMWKYCGKKFVVFKRIQEILDHRRGKMWKVRNTVILKGVLCENDPTHLKDCDQTCFYYWKEAWLKKGDPPMWETVKGEKQSP